MTQRQEVYDDLNHALRIMNIINDQTPTSNVFYAMWLLENKQLRLGLNINVKIAWFRVSLVAIRNPNDLSSFVLFAESM